MLSAIHITAVFFAIAIVLFADHEGYAWFRGKKQTLDPVHMRIAHAGVAIALAVLITTGTIMFYPFKGYLLANPLFILKLLFVGVLVVNAVIINRMMHVALEKPYAKLSREERMPLLISGGVSFVSWIGAIGMAILVFG